MCCNNCKQYAFFLCSTRIRTMPDEWESKPICLLLLHERLKTSCCQAQLWGELYFHHISKHALACRGTTALSDLFYYKRRVQCAAEPTCSPWLCVGKFSLPASAPLHQCCGFGGSSSILDSRNEWGQMENVS